MQVLDFSWIGPLKKNSVFRVFLLSILVFKVYVREYNHKKNIDFLNNFAFFWFRSTEAPTIGQKFLVIERN